MTKRAIAFVLLFFQIKITHVEPKSLLPSTEDLQSYGVTPTCNICSKTWVQMLKEKDQNPVAQTT